MSRALLAAAAVLTFADADLVQAHSCDTDTRTTSASEAGDIVDTAVAAGDFSTLVAAVQAAGLVDVLKGDGPFTLFAPSDAAFAKLPDGTLEALLEDQAQLRSILTYHVVPGRILASDIVEKGKQSFEIETAQGGALMVAIDKDGNVSVNDAKVTSVDVIAGNGVIHVIDSVVLPPSS